MNSVELFSGCGGLALGLARAGFEHSLLVERNPHAIATLRYNRERGIEHVADWNVVGDDVSRIDWTAYAGTARLVAGGPPCQPFSIGGKHRGHDDARDMWPEAVRAVREVQPHAFIFENVSGLARPAFAEYLRWITASLRRPTVERRIGETHAKHLLRLERERTTYDVIVVPVNASDFGAAQKRKRVIIAGISRDLGIELTPPATTHSAARLAWDQNVTGEYWRRHRITGRHGAGTAAFAELAPATLPWVTVRDALRGLGKPNGRANHVLQEGAKAYTGHTGSSLDEPAKALKAGDHGVPGGENMMVRDDGTVRYFTVREAARLQGLPDDYRFDGTWSENMRQLGNAVPTQLSEALGRWMMRLLREDGGQVEDAA